MTYLNEMVILAVIMDNKNETLTATRAVQRFLKRRGYKRGNKPGSSTYQLSKANVLARDTYVQLTQPLITATNKPNIVYMDESFIHQHYKRHHDSLYDTSDSADVQTNEKYKGSRHCFIVGILDSTTMDCRVLALDIFRVSALAEECLKNDNPNSINHDYFVKWFKELLDELDAFSVTNAYIVMDNANTYPTIKATIKPAIVQMATEKGHTVVYTPPHHSDLQPIELVWAIVKGHLGHKYTDGTGLLEVKARLQEAFDVLKASSISGCIKVSEEKLQKLHDHLKEIDAFESDEDSSARSSSDSDN
ncbi:hypothetical protein AaE_013353 [Aphanomyces astaci]|uniref:Tc1-like transposase DDE domain-containing protein n=1 Tax=Aphanomyces astaci TaxID=112090 RepID=A0A6A4ZBP7_APHAT|nr:hypothetical protein AaE_013353 [Aphanomyces astaci]